MNSRFRAIALVCAVVSLAAAGRAAAQDDVDSAEQGRFRLGPARFTPFIAVTNLGVDSNVFNEDVDPKQDTTGAIGPGANLWMNAGSTLLTGKASGQYLYFNKYTNQRSWNTSDEGKWEWRLARLTPFVSGAYANTRERPGYEIDSPAHLRSDTLTAGADLRLTSKIDVVASGSRSHYQFDQQEEFLGTNLADALNRTTDDGELDFRYKLTTLTTFVVKSEAIQDRFTTDTLRDSRSIKVMPGFELKPSALISGKVFVGFRQFTASSSVLPDYSGPVADVTATYVASAFKVDVKVDRDLAYSFEPTEPYYALTDLGLTLTRRVTRAWEAVGRGGRQSLAYQEVANVEDLGPRTDIIDEYGGGIGYRVGETLRLGFDVMYYQRHSPEEIFRAYDGLRYGLSISYGLPQ